MMAAMVTAGGMRGDEAPRPAGPQPAKVKGGQAMEEDAERNPALTGRLPDDQMPKTDAEWRKRLTPLQYDITRRKATERAFTGKYTDTETTGTYRCICCGEPLFRSGEKFHSGCGWPSFFAPIDGVKGSAIAEHEDRSHFMMRTEVTCRRCGAHLGHVFDDGPPPTGLRYCINSASITLDETKPPDVASKPAADK
jgi:peptide-methionine (R)-S-oxide reductase